MAHTAYADAQYIARNRDQGTAGITGAGAAREFSRRTPAGLIAAFPQGAATTCLAGDLWRTLAGDVRREPAMDLRPAVADGLQGTAASEIPVSGHTDGAGAGSPVSPCQDIYVDALNSTYRSVRSCDINRFRDK